MATNGIQLQHLVCEQPSCALKQGHMNQLRLADLLIRALSKDGTMDCIPNRMRIIPRSACIECAQRVIRGQRPLSTWAERRGFTWTSRRVRAPVRLDESLEGRTKQ